MNKGGWKIMMNLAELWKDFKFLTPLEELCNEDKKTIETFLKGEHKAREIKKIQSLLKKSGIKKIKRLEDFDWKFNPKIHREKIMQFANSDWIDKPANLTMIGPMGLGKSHIAKGLCYQAIQKGRTTVFITCYDLVAKLEKAKNVYTLIDYYSKVSVFCLDELGYIFPSQEHANYIFQIISKRSETASTIITTNLIPSHWGKIFDSATATAILDRMSLNGSFITMEGKSYRSKK
jgi:DNA replication protein DnaC